MKYILRLITLIPFFSITCNAQSWIELNSINSQSKYQSVPFISLDNNGTPYVLCSMRWDTLLVKKYDGNKWIEIGPPTYTGNMNDPAVMAVDENGVVYVAYNNYGASISVQKYERKKWVVLGGKNIFYGMPHGMSMAVDSKGIPYVSFINSSFQYPQGPLFLMKFEGNEWKNIGSSNPQDTLVGTAIVPDKKGNIFIACKRLKSGNPSIVVLKYDGIKLETIGQIEGQFNNEQQPLAIDNDGTPYIVRGGILGVPMVLKYNGSEWVSVGPDLTAKGINCSITFDDKNRPYVIYNGETDHKANVRKFNGTNWDTVGAASFSQGYTECTSIVVDSKGPIYVAFHDNRKAKVFRCGPPRIEGSDSLCLSDFSTFSNSVPGGVWSSNNIEIATVNASTGAIQCIAPGTTEISYTVSGYSSSQTIKVNDCNAGRSVVSYAYPNPNNGSFTLQVYSPMQEKATIILTNISGQQVADWSLETNKPQNIEIKVSAGIYFLTTITSHSKQTIKMAVW